MDVRSRFHAFAIGKSERALKFEMPFDIDCAFTFSRVRKQKEWTCSEIWNALWPRMDVRSRFHAFAIEKSERALKFEMLFDIECAFTFSRVRNRKEWTRSDILNALWPRMDVRSRFHAFAIEKSEHALKFEMPLDLESICVHVFTCSQIVKLMRSKSGRLRTIWVRVQNPVPKLIPSMLIPDPTAIRNSRVLGK